VGHNLSPGQRAARIRSKHLRDLERFILAIDCGTCGTRAVLIRDIAAVYGRDQTLMQAILRMRCRQCDGLVKDAELRPGLGVRGQAIPIWGNETFG
jgi:hypothetical protein